MTSVQPPPTLDDGTEQISRQLAILRGRSRRVTREIHRIQAELVVLMRRIDSHISNRP